MRLLRFVSPVAAADARLARVGRREDVQCAMLLGSLVYCCPLLLLRRSLLLHLLMGQPPCRHGSIMAPAVPSAPA